MMRARLSEALTSAMKAKDARRVSTLRLILAALKDRDIAARTEGNNQGLGEEDLLNMLATMVRQRHESIKLYEEGGRQELADQEREEITVIESFMPERLSDAEVKQASEKVIADIGAASLKDMGRTMAALKERYAGRMDFGKTADIVKQLLTQSDAG